VDRAAGEPFVKLAFGPLEERDQRRAVESVSHGEIGFSRGLRETVPGAHELAVVAAVDAVADQRPERLRDAAFVLDREVGDAAARIELVGADDGAGGTRVETAPARTAMLR
jgi:hypothetical protein